MASPGSLVEDETMRAMLRIMVASNFLLLITGCYINSKGNICSLTMPQAYCDREAYERLTKPGKLIDDWSLSGRTKEIQLKDWRECGGSSEGHYGLVDLPDGKFRTKEQIFRESKELFYNIQRCMMRKNYDYIGPCLDTEISRAHPACRARRGENWE